MSNKVNKHGRLLCENILFKLNMSLFLLNLFSFWTLKISFIDFSMYLVECDLQLIEMEVLESFQIFQNCIVF